MILFQFYDFDNQFCFKIEKTADTIEKRLNFDVLISQVTVN